jgi:murein DD-endopeptidase MepM/ murein hydrolase activator NlpD
MARDTDTDVIEQLVKEFSSNPQRNDAKGQGHFGARRGEGTHKGEDFEVEVGERIDSPAVGSVTKIGYTYTNDLSYRYVQVTDIDGNDHRMFYVAPTEGLKVGDTVNKGDILGTSQDLSKRHGKTMKQHVHYEILDPKKVPIDRATYNKRRVASTEAERTGRV